MEVLIDVIDRGDGGDRAGEFVGGDGGGDALANARNLIRHL